MKDFKKRLFGLIDLTAESAKSLVDTLSEVDLNEVKSTLVEGVKNAFNGVVPQNDFVVTVPMDRERGEKIKYHFLQKDGSTSLVITVSYDGTPSFENKTTVELPENCDKDGLHITYDKSKKVAKVRVPLLPVPVEETIEQDDDFDDVDDVPVPEETVAPEPEAPTEEPVAEPAEQPKKKAAPKKKATPSVTETISENVKKAKRSRTVPTETQGTEPQLQ